MEMTTKLSSFYIFAMCKYDSSKLANEINGPIGQFSEIVCLSVREGFKKTKWDPPSKYMHNAWSDCRWFISKKIK